MTASPDGGVRVSHVAIAVTDLDASTRFYTEGLGFEADERLFESGDEVASVSEVEPPVRMKSRYYTNGGFRLELMAWESPPVHGSASQQRNQRGLTHLSFEVEDIVATEQHLIDLGGCKLPEARIYLEAVSIALVFLTDPDGTRIELLQRNAQPLCRALRDGWGSSLRVWVHGSLRPYSARPTDATWSTSSRHATTTR